LFAPAVEGEGAGTSLRVEFDYETPTIISRHAKGYIKKRMPDYDDNSKRYQGILDAILVRGDWDDAERKLRECGELKFAFHIDTIGPLPSATFNDPEFRFRFASGGVLPVVTFGCSGKSYFCLFYRDIDPIGWNIANGGCDSLGELQDPRRALERELCEELLIIDDRNRFVFDCKQTDFPEREHALKYWARILGRQIEEQHEEVLSTNFRRGPDVLKVRFAGCDFGPYDGVFLNINAEDFGIEIDRIAEFELRGSIDKPVETLLDGEVNDTRVIGRPIGLFDVARKKELVRENAKCLPDAFFYRGKFYQEGTELVNVITGQFLPDLKKRKCRTAEEMKDWKKHKRKRKHLGLCPVTSRIIQRYGRN
jgi:hypothetical protein